MLIYDTGQSSGIAMAVCLLLVVLGILWLAAFAMCHWYAGTRSGPAGRAASNARKGFAAALLGTVLVACWMVGGMHPPRSMTWGTAGLYLHFSNGLADWLPRWFLVALGIGLLPVFALGLIGLVQARIADPVRPLRIAAGKAVLLALAATFCLWGIGMADPVTLAVIAGGGSLAMVLIALFSTTAKPLAVASEIAAERDRVMRLLEEGKINAHESAEILTALAQTMPAQATSQPLSVGRNVMIAGALVTLIGFLLPWFQVDPNAELMRIMGLNPQASVPRQVSASPEIVMQIGQARISTNPGITIRGGDVGNGLGWIALALPLLAVVLPHVAPKLPEGNVHTATLLALAAGSIITMYLLTSGWRSATYGIGIFVAGYVILWGGAIADQRRTGSATPAASMA